MNYMRRHQDCEKAFEECKVSPEWGEYRTTITNACLNAEFDFLSVKA
jgi:hypothetical protein